MYVGKARSLKARVTNYTRPEGLEVRLQRMIAATRTMEFVRTETEAEALLLEANLIKRLKPRFNVLLRDDKSFPYILIATEHEAPELMKHRGIAPQAGPLFRPLRLGARGQAHHHLAAEGVPAAHLLGQLLQGPHPPLHAAPDQALLRPLHRRDLDRGLWRAGRRGPPVPLAASRNPCRTICRREMNEAADSARFRARRPAARSPQRARPGPEPGRHRRARRRGGRRLRHRPRGRPVLRPGLLLPRPPELGQLRLPPARPTRRLTDTEVLEAFIGQFYEDRTPPKLVLLSHEPSDRAVLEEALTSRARQPRLCRSPAARRKARPRQPRPQQRARGARPPARRRRDAEDPARRRRRTASASTSRRAASRSTTTRTSPAPTRSAP